MRFDEAIALQPLGEGRFSCDISAEYWIVDGATRTLERLVLAGDLYAAAGYFHAVDDVASDRVPGLRFRVAALFEDLGAPPDSRSSET